MKVSIIVPIYGVEKYIEKCARSIFEQTYTDLELIFVNDCTPDNSISILERVLEEYPQMKDKTQILSYPKNRGLAGARKFGLEAAHGDYVLQIDSDDYIEQNDMVEAMVSTAIKTSADIVICDYNIVKGGTKAHTQVNPSLNHIICLKQILTGEVHSAVWNKLIRRSLYMDNNIAPIQGLNMREDLSVMYRLLYFAKKLAYVPQPFYNYVIREGSIASALMNPPQQQNAEELIGRMQLFFAKHNIEDKELTDALTIFKANIITAILLFGDIDNINKQYYSTVTLKHCLGLPKSQLIAWIIASLKCRPLLLLLRKTADLKYRT